MASRKLQTKYIEIITPNIPALKKKNLKMEKAYPDHKKYMGFKYMYSFKTFNKQPSLKFFHSFFQCSCFTVCKHYY